MLRWRRQPAGYVTLRTSRTSAAAVKDDEKKFLATTRESAEQLMHLFETDSEQPAEEAASRIAASVQ